MKKSITGWLFRRFFVGALEAKSTVLRGANARLHGISQAPEPKPDFADEFEGGALDFGGGEIESTPREWRYIDVTIEVPEPAADAKDCAMTLWEPDALAVVESPASAGKSVLADLETQDLGQLHAVDVMQGGNWVPLDGDKVFGSQRLRLHVGVRPGTDQFRLRYYVEILRTTG